MKTAIVYHEVKPGIPCPDGISAAWIAKRKYPNSHLFGCSYGEPVPSGITHYDRVLIVDFSFPRGELESIKAIGVESNQQFELTVIDHHKTSMADLEGFSNAIFDMTECGATLTWKTLFPDEPMPAFLEYVRDRDLWNFALPGSEEIHEAMSFMGRRMHQLDFLATLSRDELRSLLVPIGARLLEPKRKRIAEIAATARPAKIFGHQARLVEMPASDLRLVSDVCTAIYRQHTEAAFVVAQHWDEAAKTWNLSFRSDKHGSDFDVSAIAQQFGGGGHRNSAGGKSEEKLLALT